MIKKRYIICNKPYGMLSQFTGDNSATLAQLNLPKGIYAAGRLDKDSEGLLLLTDDGPFIKQLMDNHPRTYWAQVDGSPTVQNLHDLAKGVQLKDGLTKPCMVKSIADPQNLPTRTPAIRYRKSIPTSWIELTVTEGKNRQVRRMTAAIGYPTLRLVRVGVGKINLFNFNNLSPGKWIEVKKSEIV